MRVVVLEAADDAAYVGFERRPRFRAGLSAFAGALHPTRIVHVRLAAHAACRAWGIGSQTLSNRTNMHADAVLFAMPRN